MTNSFAPMETRSGIFAADFVRARPSKDIVVWGVGVLSRCLIHQLKTYAVPGQNFYFTDSSPKLYVTHVDGHLVIDFHQALERLHGGSCFMVVAVAGHMKAATNKLTEAGFKRSVDPDFQPTFINMDVEGAEPEALQGGAELIRRNCPDLGICVYHRPEHLWDIALALHALNPNFLFYLRNYTGFPAETVLYANV
jgi:hypothetical protein